MLTLIRVIVIAIMALIVPRFRMIFDQLGGELPAFTRDFMGFYDILCHDARYLIVALIAVIFAAGLLEPVMITTIGSIVLVVVIALYLPIFTISDVAY